MDNPDTGNIGQKSQNEGKQNNKYNIGNEKYAQYVPHKKQVLYPCAHGG